MDTFPKKKVNWPFAILLSALVLVALVYFGYKGVKTKLEEMKTRAYEEAEYNLITQMYETAQDCNVIGLDLGKGINMQLVDMKCLMSE